MFAKSRGSSGRRQVSSTLNGKMPKFVTIRYGLENGGAKGPRMNKSIR